MNLTKLFEMQRVLDERIVKEKGLEGKDLLPQKILALQVELGECANEWRGFKFWSKDQEPRTKGAWKYSTGIKDGKFIDVFENPLLEEYIDCLHFILSIGFELRTEVHKRTFPTTGDQHNAELIGDRFIELMGIAKEIYYFHTEEYNTLLLYFFDLGYMLGFTWEQIETAYLDKNKVNHQRQDTGY